MFAIAIEITNIITESGFKLILTAILVANTDRNNTVFLPELSGFFFCP